MGDDGGFKGIDGDKGGLMRVEGVWRNCKGGNLPTPLQWLEGLGCRV